MRKSNIHFDIALDEENIPDKITWSATDNPTGDGTSETKALCISLWDPDHKHTMRIDLWTRDMPVEEMKKFYIDMLGGLSQSLLSATDDTYMSEEIKHLADKLAQHLIEDLKNQ
jgi:gliding motility-associated protein GldC